MKLNLLPTTVSKERKAKTAWIAFGAMTVIGIAGAVFMILTSGKSLEDAKAEVAELSPKAQQVSATAASADEVIKNAQGVTRNINLARAMVKHNDVYPALYESLKNYIPPFFRLNSVSATPASETSATVTLVGTVETFKQYSDLALALLQIPDVVSVSRTGFVSDPVIRPGLQENDQVGKPHKLSESAIPDDQLERLAYFQSSVKQDSYLNAGGFGSGTEQARGATSTNSLITVQIVLKKNLMTPNPRATIALHGSSAAASPAAGGPSVGGPPPGVAGAPGGSAAAPSGGKGGGDDEDLSAAKSSKGKGAGASGD